MEHRFERGIRQGIDALADIKLSPQEYRPILGVFKDLTVNFDDDMKELKTEIVEVSARLDNMYIENAKLQAIYGPSSQSNLLRRQKSRENFKRCESKYRGEVDALTKALEQANIKISLQNEQLHERRAIWDAHPEELSTSRMSSQSTIHDPFESPVAQSRATLPYGASPYDMPTSSLIPLGSTASFTQPVDSESDQTIYHGAIQTHTSQHALSNAEISQQLADFAERLGKDVRLIFTLLEGWVREYCGQMQSQADQQICKQDSNLWDSMQDLLFPGRKFDATQHVISMLLRLDTRLWFVMRMAISHIFTKLLLLEQWKGFSVFTDHAIAEASKRKCPAPRYSCTLQLAKHVQPIPKTTARRSMTSELQRSATSRRPAITRHSRMTRSSSSSAACGRSSCAC